MLPHFHPCAHRREPTGNGNLLRNVLVFSGRKIRADIHFEPWARRDGDRGFGEIARFLDSNHICINHPHITLHSSNLSLLGDWRSIGMTAGKPLYVPESYTNHRRRWRRWRAAALSKEMRNGYQSEQRQPFYFHRDVCERRSPDIGRRVASGL